MTAPYLLPSVLDATAAGFCAIPASNNGTKQPYPDTDKWGRYQTERPTESVLRQWFGEKANRYTGFGLVPGKVSGNLECLEFEGRAVAEGLWDAFKTAAAASGLGDVLARICAGYFEESPSGGYHLLYRCDGVAGGTKLARRPATAEELAVNADDKVKTLAETKGEHDFIIVAPSNGRTHPTGRPWKLLSGGFATVTIITADERTDLLDLVRSFDQMPVVEYAPAQPRGADAPLRPGDDFNLTGDPLPTLKNAGWVKVYDRPDGNQGWRRPGKTRGSSATWHPTKRVLYLFSSSTVFPENEKGYSPFAVVAFVDHDGDFSAAARKLAEQGFGAPPVYPADLVGDGSKGNEEADSAGEQADTEVEVALDGLRYTDADNAGRLVTLAGGKIRYVHGWGKWIVYKRGRWIVDNNDAYVTEEAKKVARSLFGQAKRLPYGSAKQQTLFKFAVRSHSSGAIAAAVRLARAIDGVITDHEDLDADPYLLNVKNGTVNLRNGQLQKHDPDDLLTLQAPVRFDPDAAAPLWEECLLTWQPEDEIRSYLQVEAGAATTGFPTETLSIYHGSGGNGKSKYLGALQHVAGPYSAVPHKSLLVVRKHEEHETEKAKMFRVRLAVSEETDVKDTLNDAQVKALTGAGRIEARRMREDPWGFMPTHTLILGTNYAPTIQGRDQAIWRRVRLIPWTVTISPEDIDLHLAEKLRAEAEGILRWMVEGAVKFIADGFDPPEAVLAATAQYRADQDVVGRFAAEVLRFGNGYWAWSADIKRELDLWSADQGIDPPRMDEIAAALKAKGARSVRQSIAGLRGTTWSNVGIAEMTENAG